MSAGERIVYWIALGIYSFVCGLISMYINKEKGYGTATGFAWGFSLGLIGIAVVGIRSKNLDPIMNREEVERDNEKFLKENDGWECPCCTRLHGPLDKSCICGFVLNEEGFAAEEETVKESYTRTADYEAEIISKYKKMYEDGIITEEEFKEKKKQILGI